ncbi:Ubiquitin-like protein [Glarea lozoyensis ATCC 20868]|uniref:Ubiquitin-like protein n=1 Tax=Glarea lozoyensis (strain ATCC 20868 / MF5171) TaxID=1116229 RepID=S3CH27_GLAL2|nr:Ubiquitin-like protein [Glarea lozoyensis ATCC 20868]EPE25175.1 Ubiquitin-like protein [Glarea lozoyensis ATCC 20868]
MSDNEMSPEEEKPKIDNTILIRLKNQSAQESTFKIKPTTLFEKIINAYAKMHGKKVDTFRFFFDGHRLQATDTPKSLEMADGDLVDVFLEQTGGGC